MGLEYKSVPCGWGGFACDDIVNRPLCATSSEYELKANYVYDLLEPAVWYKEWYCGMETENLP